MKKTNIELLFEWLDQTAELLQQHTDVTYLDSLQVALDSLFYQHAPEDADDLLKQKLTALLATIELEKIPAADVQKAVSFAILKGMKDSAQLQHQQTPEAVSLLIGYLAQKLTKDMEKVTLFDPACGTSNLLMTVVNQLDKPAKAYGSEIDPTLIKLSLSRANLQKSDIEFFHQDSLRPFLLDPADIVVSDLPVGYYPDDIRAEGFELKADNGHSYAHHLFIEQCMNYVSNQGYAILLIPNFLFDSDQAEKLQAYLQKNAHVVGLITLAESVFASKKNAKSILILQKKNEKTVQPKQPLLVKLPSLKNAKAMDDILDQMNAWFAEYTR